MLTDKHGSEVQLGVTHHKIHHGRMFTVSDIDTDVDTGGPKYWRVVTPADLYIHMEFKVTADNDAVMEIYRAPTVTGAGSALAVLNRNENSPNVASTTAFKDTTVSADGTLRETARVGTGSNKNTGQSSGERGDEIILLPSTDYTVKVTVGNNDTSVELHLNFYEEDHL